MSAILVTGAGGFIGQAVVNTLVTNGYPVVALLHRSRPDTLLAMEREGRITTATGSITDPRLPDHLLQYGPFSAVVHCAGRASDVGRERLFRETILEGTHTIISLMEKGNIPRLVHISTTDVYGLKDFNNADEETPFDETCSNPYPKYKILAEQAIASHLSPERTVILRPAAVWGPGDKTLTPRIVAFLKSSPWIIHFGRWQGRNRWPAVHVDTVCQAVLLGIRDPHAARQAINVVDPEIVSIDLFYRRLIDLYLPEKKDIRSITLPFWLGWIVGRVNTALSNLLNRHQPVSDPTLYGLYSVSRNLDFNGQRFQNLLRKRTHRP